ncbi:unnamed protein product [Linum tenue]|uniref:Uncharacterized protein n=1 Tax=Linum tenue TaxID=586396 RepID=A0AAV0IZS5_9ROSI|nr:unnamed protein product [Linum tenue]
MRASYILPIYIFDSSFLHLPSPTSSLPIIIQDQHTPSPNGNCTRCQDPERALPNQFNHLNNTCD